MFDVVHVLEKLKNDPGVKAIGVFGSRSVKEHTPLKSDFDLFVINDSPITYDWSPSRGSTASREIHRYTGIGKGINIQECSTEEWEGVANNPYSVKDQTYEIMKSVTRWLWVKKGYKIIPIPQRGKNDKNSL